MFLEECLISFKMYGDGKKYIYILRYGVCKIWEKYVWIFCEECVCKIYGSMREMEVKYSKCMSL